MRPKENKYLSPIPKIGDLYYTEDNHVLLVYEVYDTDYDTSVEWTISLLSYGPLSTFHNQVMNTSYTTHKDKVNQVTIWVLGKQPRLHSSWRIVKCNRALP